MLQIQSSRDFLQILFRYRGEAINSVIAVVVVFILGMLIKSPSFTSEAKLFVQLGKENQELPATVRSAGDVLPATPSRDQLLDEQKILLSNNVVTEVAKHFMDVMSRQTPPPGVWNQIKRHAKKAVAAVINGVKKTLTFIGLRDPREPIDSLKEDLLKQFKINHDPGSAVIDVSFAWDDPVIAREVLSYWLKTYRAERDSLQGYGDRLKFYETQVNHLKQSIRESQFELQKHLVDAGSSNIANKMEALSKNLVEATNAKYKAQNELNSLLSGITAAKREMGRIDKNTVLEERSVLNPTRADLSERLNQLILERESMLTKFVPGSKKIQAMDESIAEVKRMIAEEPDRTVGDQLTKKNPNYIELENDVQDRNIRTEELRTSIASYDKQIADLRGELESLVNRSVYINLLETDIEKYQDEYKNYKGGLEKARLEKTLESNSITNVRIMQEPTFNPVRSSIKPLAAIALCPLVAVLVALLVCYLIAMTDRRIYDRSSISARSPIQIIDTIPAPTVSQHDKHTDDQRYDTAMFRLAAALKRLAAQCSDGKEEQSITVTTLNQKNSGSLMIDLERIRQRLDANFRLLDGKDLADTMTSYPIINGADRVIVTIESAKVTVPQLMSQLSALQLTFPEKLLGVVVYNRRYEIPDKLFNWISR